MDKKLLYLANIDMRGNNGAVEHIKGFLDGYSKEGGDIHLVSMCRPSNTRRINILIKNFIYQMKTSIAILEYAGSNVYVRYSPLTILPFIVGIMTGKTIFAEINGALEEEANLLYNVGGIIKYFSSKIASASLRISHHIFVPTEGLKEYTVSHYGLSDHSVTVMPNAGYSGKASIRNEFSGKGVVLFSGKAWYGINKYCSIASELKNHNVQMDIFVSEINEDESSCKLIKNTKFTGGDYDWGLLAYEKQAERILCYGVTPIKYFTYMMYGIPPIHPDIADISKITKQCNCGYIYNGLESDSIVEAILSIYNDKELWKTKCQNAVKCINEKYNWNNAAIQIMEMFNEF